MRICIPTKNDEGLASIVYGHFGSAPYFLVYDTETSKMEAINNSDQGHEHGRCKPLASFVNHPIDAVVTGGIGLRAMERLSQGGVKVYRMVSEPTVLEVIEKYRQGLLEEIALDDACSHDHDCNH
ncbi:MAG: NifB/NifX family molybdenum-iron cluster-binding protein [Actinomycetota bacterium]|nr:NifB/NifX family molybdenum-iron cluster-binding protein [Actinomycetota bacterium]